MNLKVVNKKLQWGDGQPCTLVHADSPESRLHPNYKAQFLSEAAQLPYLGINCITATLRGDDITAINPWINNSPANGVDISKLEDWHFRLKYFLDTFELQSAHQNLRGVCILYLGERANFKSITTAQYQQWIDAMAPIFSDIQGQLIFGWEEIWDGSAQGTINFANNIGSYLKSKLPNSLIMVHNNPGQKPWSVPSTVVDLMCIQETSMSAMGASGIDAFNKGYAVHLHEPYNGFRVSNSQTTNLANLDIFLQQAQAETSGYGIFAADYDLQAPDASKLSYLYEALSTKLNGGIITPPNPQPTNMIIGYSKNSNRLDFAPIPSNLPVGSYFVEARECAAPVTFNLTKDGVAVRLGASTNERVENGTPYDMFGGPAFNFTAGNYVLTTKDKTNAILTNTFTVGTAPQPVLGCTDPNATNYNPAATQDDGSCTYPPSDKPEVIVDITANPDEVTLIIRVNGTAI